MKKLFFAIIIAVSNVSIAQYEFDDLPGAKGPDLKFIRYLMADIFTNPQVKYDLIKYGIDLTDHSHIVEYGNVKFSEINFPIICDTVTYKIVYEFRLDYDYDDNGNFLNYNGNSHEEVAVIDRKTNRPIYWLSFTYLQDKLYAIGFYDDAFALEKLYGIKK